MKFALKSSKTGKLVINLFVYLLVLAVWLFSLYKIFLLTGLLNKFF
ncbi:hypothetical protein ACFL0Y_02100 [Patescibacteria group bacterium]